MNQMPLSFMLAGIVETNWYRVPVCVLFIDGYAVFMPLNNPQNAKRTKFRVEMRYAFAMLMMIKKNQSRSCRAVASEAIKPVART